MPTRKSAIHLFKLFGIDVYLHWSWFVVALYEIEARKGAYTAITWNILEYLTLFLIVTIHEFGHALACRSVGGQANQIVLWPLGGVAYVAPPQRPGAMLWSIAAGPLVNVLLVPILTLLWWFSDSNWSGNVSNYFGAIWYINLVLLVFNLLPVYPLDGGQILRSILWFFLGRARSLMTASILGFIGVGGLALFAVWFFTISPQVAIWYCVICVFILFNCVQGFKQAKLLLRLDHAPRREDCSCPQCHASPPIGDFWTCQKCRKPFDIFAAHFACPHCGVKYRAGVCFECGRAATLSEWSPAPSVTTAPPPDLPQ